MLRPAPSGSKQKRAGRPRIALLAAYLNDEYEWEIWRGVRAAVEARGGSVVCFAGAGLGDPRPEWQARSTLFELVEPANVDGILCLSSVVAHYAGLKTTEAWLLERGVLTVSIGPGERVPNVMVEDAAGVTQLVQHLIEYHGHRRIAFISGTSTSSEAQNRLAAYERALVEYGLKLDPRLVLPGDFTFDGGARAISELFDRRQVGTGDFDAVLASNDYMALGAMDELMRRRVSVPNQVAVVGFDDILPARLSSPTLTTVKQPLEQLGRTGAERLLDLIEGRTPAGARTLSTELVLRRSCGCLPTEIPPSLENPLELDDKTVPGRAQLAVTLETALAAELHGAPGTFARALDPYLREAAAGNQLDLDHGRRFADELATRLRLAREDLVHERLSRLARALHLRMFGPQALLSTALAELLPAFGMGECVVSEFVEGEPGARGRALKLAFGFDANTLQPQMATIDARELVPSRFEKLLTGSVVVLPLTCGAQSLGIAVLPAGDRDGGFYESLAELFGTILKVLELRRAAR